MELDGTRVLAFGTAGAQGSGLVGAIEARGATGTGPRPGRTRSSPI